MTAMIIEIFMGSSWGQYSGCSWKGGVVIWDGLAEKLADRFYAMFYKPDWPIPRAGQLCVKAHA